MNAADIRDRLTQRWPDDRYLHVYEAPTDAMRLDAKIDVLVMGLWASDGRQLDAVEIKCSYSDWCKEWRSVEWVLTCWDGAEIKSSRKFTERDLDAYRGIDRVANEHTRQHRLRYPPSNPPPPDDYEPTVERRQTVDVTKNIDWRLRANRFWIAAPDGLAQKVKADIESIPELAGWGALAVPETGPIRALIKPKTIYPPQLTPDQWLGVVRAAANSGRAALFRAEQRGRSMGVAEAKANALAREHRQGREACYAGLI